MANDMGSTIWYNLSIYFYLHFQYNGFFFFGILALFFALLERKVIYFDPSNAKAAGVIFAVACAPAYLLSTLWTRPGYFIQIMGTVAAVAQCFGFAFLLKLLFRSAHRIRTVLRSPSLLMLSVALAALALKLILQLISAHPYAAQMAYELRPVVIAYLHLVLLGVITLFLLGWYIENDFIRKQFIKPTTTLFLFSFIGMETILVLTPWWSSIAVLTKCNAAECCFGFATLLSVSYFISLLGSFGKKSQ
jgi:hypothetical protein